MSVSVMSQYVCERHVCNIWQVCKPAAGLHYSVVLMSTVVQGNISHVGTGLMQPQCFHFAKHVRRAMPCNAVFAC